MVSSAVLGKSRGNRHSAWMEDGESLHLQLHPSVTCVFCFDVLLVFDGIGKGLVTGAALQR